MNQQHFWNGKFSREGYLYGKSPNEFIKSCSCLFDKKKDFLCLGEGEGRNAIYFAKKGFSITALDASDIGLKKLHLFAEEENVHIQTKCIDLTTWQINKKYASIVASYLHLYEKNRDEIFKKIEESLESGGVFVGEFFSKKQLNFSSGGPKDLELLYEVEDFSKRFNSCEKIQVEEILTTLNEGKGHQGEACVIRVVLKKQ